MGQANLEVLQMGALKLLPELMERMLELLRHAVIIMAFLVNSVVLMRHCEGIRLSMCRSTEQVGRSEED